VSAWLLLFAAGLPPVLAVPATAILDDQVVGGRPVARMVTLDWPADARLTAAEDGTELVVRANRPIADAAIERVRTAAGDAIDDLRWNDTSVVLRAAPGWTLSWQARGASVLLTFVPLAEPTVTAPDTGARELARARVQADLAAGYPGRARRGAMALLADDPTDRQGARLLAEARFADGDLVGAAADYRRLAAPDDLAARRVIASGAGTASIGTTMRDGRGFSQVEVAARADLPIGGAATANAGARVIASRVDTGRGTRSAREPVIDAGIATAIGDRTRVAILASSALDDDVTGGGVRIVHGSAEAQLRGSITYRLPDYSTAAQVLGRGFLTRAAVGGSVRLSAMTTALIDGGWNRYGLAGREGGTSTLTLAGGIDHLIRRQFPTLGLSYRLEAEYIQRATGGTIDDGALPLFLATRENHTLQGLIGTTLGEVSLTGLAGWTVDRFGGDGPTASLGIAAPIGVAWRAEAGAGITSVARQGFGGRQLFARAQVTRSLGDGR